MFLCKSSLSFLLGSSYVKFTSIFFILPCVEVNSSIWSWKHTSGDGLLLGRPLALNFTHIMEAMCRESTASASVSCPGQPAVHPATDALTACCAPQRPPPPPPATRTALAAPTNCRRHHSLRLLRDRLAQGTPDPCPASPPSPANSAAS
jgi:hypothetical protein